MQIIPRPYLILASIALLISLFQILIRDTPGYTDAYYYYNAGAELAQNGSLTDHYLWVYINAPDALPTASHRYWMPLASIVAALPMWFLGVGFGVARLGFIPFYIALGCLGMWLGGRLGGGRRHAWVTGLSVLFGGFYFPFWLTTDTFALYGVVGAGALVALGVGAERGGWRWYALAGGLTALAHLARADGVLFLLVGLWVIFWKSPFSLQARISKALALCAAYLLVMLPWFGRSMAVMGSPLPAGGLQTVFLRGYNDIFSYPAAWSAGGFGEWGAENILRSRLDGLLVAFQTWLAVEGVIMLAPLALWALWSRRQERFLAPMLWYALGLHAAMALVFTYPGARGGLFHSSAALFPFWMALGVVGLDQIVEKLARWRRWRTGEAQFVFGWAVLLLPLALGYVAWSAQTTHTEPDYPRYAEVLPPDARIMVNDAAAWFYHTGYGGVALPDEPLPTALEIAKRYCITHLVIDQNVTSAFEPLLRGATPPPFLREVQHFSAEGVRVYAFEGVSCE